MSAVLTFPLGCKVFVALAPVDMRKQFNGLWAVAQHHLGEDPRQGAMFVFANRDRDRVKLLYWDGTGVWVLANAEELESNPESGDATQSFSTLFSERRLHKTRDEESDKGRETELLGNKAEKKCVRDEEDAHESGGIGVWLAANIPCRIRDHRF